MALYDRLLPTLADITPEDPQEKLKRYLQNSATIASINSTSAKTAAQRDANRLNSVLTEQERQAALATPELPTLKRKAALGDAQFELDQQPRQHALSDLKLDYDTGATQGKISNLPFEIAADRSNYSKVPAFNDIQLENAGIGLNTNRLNYNEKLKDYNAFTPEHVMQMTDPEVIAMAKVKIPGFSYDQESISDPSFVNDLRKSLMEKSVAQQKMLNTAKLGAVGFEGMQTPESLGWGWVMGPDGQAKLVQNRTIDTTTPKPNPPSLDEKSREELRKEAAKAGMKNWETANSEELAEYLGKNSRSTKAKLQQYQSTALVNLDNAEYSLNEIEKKINEMSMRGPITGRIRGANPYDVDAQALQNMVSALVPGLARGVFGEVGVLTDQDRQNYEKLIPNIRTDPSVAAQIVKDLRAKLKRAREINLNVWNKGGYDVSGFMENSGNGPTDQYQKENPLPGEKTDYPTYSTPEEVPDTVLYFYAPDGRLLQNPNYKGQ